MGATEILQVLGKGDKLTAVEIAERSECNLPSLRHSIKRLSKDISENLKFRVLTKEEKIERYGHNVGCKIHIYWLEKNK
jgi:phage regulator Rha-like protein